MRSTLFQVLLFAAWATALVSSLYFPEQSQPVLELLILLALLSQLLRSASWFSGDLLWRFRLRQREKTRLALNENQWPFVSILVPCYNEENVIHSTLTSLSQIDYPHYEVLVLDDGSKDRTAELAQEFALTSTLPIRVIRKENSGKASSLNRGIQESQGELILCVDADSQIEPRGLRQAVAHFIENARLGGLAGVVEVGNDDRPLTQIQSLEYKLSNLQKSFFSHFGLVPIIPGPAGLFRRQALLDVGGYDEDRETFAEDAELTLRLIAGKWDVIYEPALISRTEAPEEALPLLRQRYRWFRGTSQALSKTLKPLWREGQWRERGFWAAMVFEQQILLVIESSLLLAFLARVLVSAEVAMFAVPLVILMLCDVLLAHYCLWGGKKIWAQALRLSFAMRFNYSIVLTTWRSLSLLDEWGRVSMSWDQVHRKGRLTRPSVQSEVKRA